MAKSSTFWLVGHFIEEAKNGDNVWRYCGLFKTEKQACDIALSICNECFVAEVNVGCMEAANPDFQCDWNSYYPAYKEVDNDSD